MIKKIDRKTIRLISKDLPLNEKPFTEIAGKLGITEKVLLKRMRAYKKNGVMRKFDAVVNHRKIGFKYNAMVVWDVSGKYVAKAGKVMASFSEVSHCYERKKVMGWKYNLYSMVHGKTRKSCYDVVEQIVRKVDCREYLVLFSSKEYKKTGVKY